jgi:hypothetical protein
MAKARKKSVDVLADPIAPQNSGGTAAAVVDRERIQSRAYELYLARGRQPGRALEDWLEAEQELLQSTRRTRDPE